MENFEITFGRKIRLLELSGKRVKKLVLSVLLPITVVLFNSCFEVSSLESQSLHVS